MKRIVSLLVAVAMVLTTVTVCVLPAVALTYPDNSDGEYYAENDQFIISTAREDLFNLDEDRTSRPGGVYTDDGFSVNPLDAEYSDYKVNWPNNAPYFTVQTKAYVNEGFYMEIRIDDFSCWNVVEDEYGNETYNYTDHWFSFSVWDSVGVMPGQLGVDSNGNDWGNGIETLIRFDADGETGDISLRDIMWYDDTENFKSSRFLVGITEPGVVDIRDDGKLYLTFELRPDYNTGLAVPYINGQRAAIASDGCDYIPKSLDAMICDNYYKAYIGFTLQSAQKDGAASFTVTKIGTSAADAMPPVGYENIPAAQRNNAVADIEPRDPEADPAEPAFVFTGDPYTYKNMRDVSGAADLGVTEDGTILVQARNDYAMPILRTFNDQSYDLNDYPYMALIVKNYCTCQWEDLNYDGIADPFCVDHEAIYANYMAGDYPNAGLFSVNSIKCADMSYTDDDGNTYSIYYFDFENPLWLNGLDGEAQRIHGINLRFCYIKTAIAGRNQFEIVAMAHLATVDGAIEWAGTYLEDFLGISLVEDTTEPPEGNNDYDGVLSVGEAADLACTMQNGEYTDERYYVKGTVFYIYDEDVGGMVLVDDDFNVLDISSLRSEDGSLSYDELDIMIMEGDTVTVCGVIGMYDDCPQMLDAYLIDHEPIYSGNPEPDSYLSLDEACYLGLMQDHNTYTEGKYYVTGTIYEVYNGTYGNMILVDDEFNEFVIYGSWSEDGRTRYDALEVKPVEGDVVTVYGIIGQFNGTPQIKNGWIVEHIPATEIEPEPDALISLEMANNMGLTMDEDTYTYDKYFVIGIIADISNAQKGYLTITDEYGDTLKIVGIFDYNGQTEFGDFDPMPGVGDVLALYGVIGNHDGVACMKDAWMQLYMPGEESTEEYPETETETETETEPETQPQRPQRPVTTESPSDSETIENESQSPDSDVPAPNTTLDMEQAIEVGLSMGPNKFTDGKYYVTGTIVKIYNATRGNLEIADEYGNTISIYGTWNYNGAVSYDKLSKKPVVGDTITVYGIIGQSGGVAQIRDGWIVEHEPAQTKPEETDITTKTETEATETEIVTETETTTEIIIESSTSQMVDMETHQSEDIFSGCGAVAGLGTVAMIAISCIGLFAFKKKED